MVHVAAIESNLCFVWRWSNSAERAPKVGRIGLEQGEERPAVQGGAMLHNLWLLFVEFRITASEAIGQKDVVERADDEFRGGLIYTYCLPCIWREALVWVA